MRGEKEQSAPPVICGHEPQDRKGGSARDDLLRRGFVVIKTGKCLILNPDLQCRVIHGTTEAENSRNVERKEEGFMVASTIHRAGVKKLRRTARKSLNLKKARGRSPKYVWKAPNEPGEVREENCERKNRVLRKNHKKRRGLHYIKIHL